jgi:hypothetical protein
VIRRLSEPAAAVTGGGFLPVVGFELLWRSSLGFPVASTFSYHNSAAMVALLCWFAERYALVVAAPGT